MLSLNDPALAYSGANAEVNSALQAAGFELLGEGTPGFFRRDDRAAPHNLFADVSALFPLLVSSGDAVPVFQYRAPGSAIVGTPVTFAQMLVGSYDVRWDWDATQGLFLRSQLGTPHELTEGRASTDNVVVLVHDGPDSPSAPAPPWSTPTGTRSRGSGVGTRRRTRSSWRPVVCRSSSPPVARGSSSSTSSTTSPTADPAGQRSGPTHQGGRNRFARLSPMTPDEFRHAGYRIVDWIADYIETIESRPVTPDVAPGSVLEQLPEHPPAVPESFEAVLADVDRIVAPAIVNWQHPSFFAYFPANCSYAAILGELLSSGLGVNGMSWVTSPACTELEQRVVDWLAELLGLPTTFRNTSDSGGGVIQGTASEATLVAVLSARWRATGGAVNADGDTSGLVAYATAQAHSSIEKALRIAGVGSTSIRVVDHDAEFAMIPERLWLHSSRPIVPPD